MATHTSTRWAACWTIGPPDCRTRPGSCSSTRNLSTWVEWACEMDDNSWWRLACGHHQNLFEEAYERLQAYERPAATCQGDGPFEFTG